MSEKTTVTHGELVKRLRKLLKKARKSESTAAQNRDIWYWEGFKDAVNSIGESLEGPEWAK